MSPEQLLQIVDVATPCRADWNSMTGDNRSRFCGQCRKHVYNLSAMSADQAVALIREKEGDLCIRLYRRTDGTVLSGDCPVGVGRVWRRIRALAAGVVAAGALVLGTQVWSAASTRVPAGSNPAVAVSSTPPLRQRWRELVDDVKTWLGFARPAPPACVVMGAIEPPTDWSERLSEINQAYESQIGALPPAPPSSEPASDF